MALICEAFDIEGVGEIRALYRKLRYGSEEGSVAATAQAAPVKAAKTNEGVMTKTFDNHLPSWRDVMQPHPDVAEGRYRAAEFAADLAQVSVAKGRLNIETL